MNLGMRRTAMASGAALLLCHERHGHSSDEGNRVEVQGDLLMRPVPVWLLGIALAPMLCLTACTSDNDPASGRAATMTPRTSADPFVEKKLTAQAQSALDAVTEQGQSMIESGVERVADGVHTQPDLAAGHSYELTVICAGKGEAQIVFAPGKTAPKKAAPCDRSVVFERFTSGKALRIDVEGDAQATGIIAWRIDTI